MPEALIDYYKAIELSSIEMLEAARAQDWDGVLRFEGNCSILIQQLRIQSREKNLPAELRREKTKIMKRILTNDAMIRLLTEPWLEQFETIISGKSKLVH